MKSSAPTRKRYEGLDHLRGVLALTVMVYHLLSWMDVELPFIVKRPIDLLGLYAVSTFYALSGAALFIVYRSRDVDRKFVREFTIKRAFRIVPLFWFVTIASLALAKFQPVFNDPWRIFLNFSLLFSWLDPAGYYATGSWSIGNEWAFYTLFPLLLLSCRSRLFRPVVFGIGTAISVYYAFFIFDHQVSVPKQWAAYVAPLNQLILFLGGMWMGHLILEKPQKRFAVPVLGSATLVFLIISWLWTTQHCVHGLLRLALVIVSLAWCFGAGLVEREKSKLSKLLDWVGGLSYSVYLIHPLVYRVTSKVVEKLSPFFPSMSSEQNPLAIGLIFVISIAGTLLLSHLTYRLLELPMIKMGKRLANRPEPKVASSL